MTSKEIREKFLRFFKERGHAIIPSASLIPENDPTLLFVNSGMYPLIPYLLGEEHPEGVRLVDSQKCIRTIDIDEVGDNRHLTFFEMLGFWSLGDYFKSETIRWTYEFMTDKKNGLGLDPARLYVTCYEGDKNVAKDIEAAKYWIEAGIPEHRIYFLGENNWWTLPSETSPCGPSSEIFYDVAGNLGALSHEEFVVADESGKVVEIGNDVFMTYVKDGKGGLDSLPKKNVDVGWGFERLVVMAQGVETVFETDLFMPIIKKIEELSGKNYGSHEITIRMRIIADHLRAATFIIGDDFGVLPSNKDQGYILRRLIRRAIVQGEKLGITGFFTGKIAHMVIDEYGDAYPELRKNRERILTQLDREEQKFPQTLKIGLAELKKLERIGEIGRIREGEEPKILNRVDAKKAFYVFQTFGLPLELIQEELAQRGLMVDEKEFNKEFNEEYKSHQEISRAGSEQKFVGGLADHSAQVIHGHTATHLMHQALRTVLGDHVAQKGSNITAERLRFDFSHSQKMTLDEIRRVEEIVNEQIKKDLPVYFEVLDMEEAKARGALGFFDDKYAMLGGKIKVYFVGDEKRGFFSKEICGGPHVAHTGEIGSFKIIKEEAVAAGIRRIKAIVE